MILVYHNIGKKAGFNTLPIDFFKAQMEYLSQSGRFTVLSLKEYVINLKDRHIKNPICITFDDGYESIKTHVQSVVESYKIPITVFIPTKHVGGFNVWDTKNGEEQLNILDWQQILDLDQSKCISFESHGHSHCSFGTLSVQQMDEDLHLSKQILEEKLARKIQFFSFPYGQEKDRKRGIETLLSKHGFEAATSTIWKRANNEKQRYFLNRIEIQPQDDLKKFKRILHRKIDIKRQKQRLKSALFKLRVLK